eukprot:2777898-Pyramimonas_sp.AAC.1
MPLGVSSGVSWGRPEGPLGRLGNVLAVPEAFWGVMGASGGLLGPRRRLVTGARCGSNRAKKPHESP